MRYYFRKWMIVAEPSNPDDEISVAAAKQWNRVYLGEGLNRYFTLGAAEIDVAEHQKFWQPWIAFRVVDRQQWHAGWV